MNEVLKEIISHIELPEDQLKDQDPEIREIFIEEVQEIIESLEKTLPQWLKDASNKSVLTDIRRSFHTLKGSGRMAGAVQSGELGWSIEEMLNRVMAGTVELSYPIQQLVYSVAMVYKNFLIPDFENGAEHQLEFRPWIAAAQRLRDGQEVESALAYTIDYYQHQTIPAEETSVVEIEETVKEIQVEAEPQHDNIESQTLDIFLEESSEHLQTIASFLHLQEELGIEHFNRLIRAVHTIRGSSGMVGFDAIFTASSHVENVYKNLEQDHYAEHTAERQLLLDYYEYVNAYVTMLAKGEKGHNLQVLSEQFQEIWQAYEAQGSYINATSHTQGLVVNLLNLDINDMLDAEFSFATELEQNPTGYLAILVEQAHTLKDHTSSKQTEVLHKVTENLLRCYQAFIQYPDAKENHEILNTVQTLHQYLIDAFDGLASGQNIVITHLIEEEFEQVIAEISAVTIEPKEIIFNLGESVFDEPKSEPEAITIENVVGQAANTDFDPDLLDIFLEESEELVVGMDEDFNTWEQEPNNTQVLKNLFRYLHTLKGGANMVQATHLGTIAHELESIYERVQKGLIQPDTDAMRMIRYAQDEIATRLQRLRNESIDEDNPILIAQLRTIATGVMSTATSDVSITKQPDIELPKEEFTLSVEDVSSVETAPKVHIESAEAQSTNTDFDPDLLDIFLEESEELVVGMDEDFNTWEQEPNNTQVLKNLFRYLHTLKGGANMVQATHLGTIAHELESIYERVQKGLIQPDADAMRMIRYAQDEIATRLQRLRNESIDEDNPTLIAQLRTIAIGEMSTAVSDISMVQQPDIKLPKEEFTLSVEDVSSVEIAPKAHIESAEAQSANTDFDPDLLDIFLEESEELVVGMDEDFNTWEQEPDNIQVLKNLFRYLHTLKGGANMVQATHLGTIAHELESIYERVQKGLIQPDADAMRMIRYAQDEIATRLQRLRNESIDEDNPILIAQLRAIAVGSSAQAAQTQHVVEPKVAIDEKEMVSVEEEITDSVSDHENTFEELVAPTEDIKPSIAPNEAVINEKVTIVSNDVDTGVPLILAKARESGDEERIVMVESYFEEASELLKQGEVAFEQWKADRNNRSLLLTLQRAYHTLKGNSRLINEQLIGVMTYQLEVVFEQYAIHQFTSDRYDSLIRHAQSWLHDAIYKNKFEGAEALKARLQNIRYEDTLIPTDENQVITETIDFNIFEDTKFVQGDGSTPPEMYAKLENKQEQQAQELIRISADLVEKMIDLSGESAINRSRIELDLGLMTTTLTEMELAIQRLADQLRRMDGELESQIMARHEVEGQRYVDFDPLEMDQYSSLNQLSKSLAESASDLIDFKTTLADKIRDTENLLLQQSRLQNELQQSLMGTRLVPFSRLVPRLQRLVRQTSTQLNRPVDFNIENTEGELDRNILERLVSPLEHMLRNAIDHGIEDQEGRVAAGKSKTGRINLNIAREGNDILVIFSDDGRGINVEAVKKKAQTNGLITPDMQVSDVDVMQYIFHAGLSTAQKVSQISGRGVGLDVVQNEIKSMGGHVSVTSELGKGTEFTIRVPTSVAVSDALMVKVGDQQFALPLTQIERIVRVSPVALTEYYDSRNDHFELDQQRYRLRYVGEFVTGQARPVLSNMGSSVPVIIFNSAGRSVALQVDQLIGSRAQIVIKPIGKQLNSVGYVGGATILADGRVCLILDGSTIARRVLTTARSYQVEQAVQQTEVRVTRKTVMVVDDSVTVRKVTSRLLERHGFDVVTAQDGLDAIEKLAEITAPDIMLLDIEMPRMDGFEVANYVRHDSHYKDLPIIMITSRTGEKHRERALSLGVNEYMGKPFQEAALIENITKILAGVEENS